MKAIIFTRHTLTEKQMNEIKEWFPPRFEVKVENHVALASITIRTMEEAKDIVDQMVDGKESVLFFGVFPPAIRRAIMLSPHHAKIATLESFNVNRAPEGEKPLFEHKEWLLTKDFSDF